MARVAVLALLLAISLGAAVEATFAAEAGFSGRRQDCTVCHAPASPAASAVLDGLPTTWMPGEPVTLQIAVEGGPDALPGGPAGGFELEVESGTLSAPPEMEGLLRFVGDTIVTYTPEGTERRYWSVVWTPDGPAKDLGVWLAVMAANGNHLQQPGIDDDGENGDATDTLHAVVPADPAAVAAWLDTPMEPPQAAAMRDGDRWIVTGRHVDPEATHLGYRIGGGAWRSQATDRDWRLVAPGDADAIEVRSEGGARTSPPLEVVSPGVEAPAPAWAVGVALGVALLVRRTKP